MLWFFSIPFLFHCSYRIEQDARNQHGVLSFGSVPVAAPRQVHHDPLPSVGVVHHCDADWCRFDWYRCVMFRLAILLLSLLSLSLLYRFGGQGEIV